MAALSKYHTIQHHKRNPISEPLETINLSCNKNITLSQPNSYYPNTSGTIWTNCCDEGAGPPSCQPIETLEKNCPVGYYSCADSDYHKEMCSIKYFASQDGSGVYGYGKTLSRTLQQKCCPAQFSCGGSFDAPCIYIGVQQNPTEPAILTNPMYVKSINVYPGCDENGISPAAVGGVVAVAILGIVLIGGLLLWLVKKRLHRDPNRQARMGRKSLTTSASRGNTADTEYGESDIGMAGTRDDNAGLSQPTNPPKERHGIMHSRSKSAAATSGQGYEMEGTKSRMFAKGDGEFSAVELGPQPPTSVLDFAGITVTSEIQVIREHGNASPATYTNRAESLRGDRYSISSRSAISEKNYEPAPLVRPPSNVVIRPPSPTPQESHH